MTAGNDGASTPEDDDPFGYLYADGQASGATPPPGSGGYGYPGPRASYHQVRAVGERQYGQQGQQPGRPGGYGYPPQQGRPGTAGQGVSWPQDGRTAALGQVPQQGAYPQGQGAYPQGGDTHYQAPETLPGGHRTTGAGRPGQGDGPGRGRGGRGGPNTKGLLIGAIAVVAAVAIGIGVAMRSGDETPEDPSAQQSPTSAPTATGPASGGGDGKDDAPLPKADAKALKLEGATVASDVKGATASDGIYVGGFNHVGAAVTWTVDGIPASGKYSLYVAYGVPGKDQSVSLTVNGKQQTTKLGLKNWAKAKEGDWEKGWTSSYAYLHLNKGTNVLRISCEQGDQCDANLDRVWLVKGWVDSGD